MEYWPSALFRPGTVGTVVVRHDQPASASPSTPATSPEHFCRELSSPPLLARSDGSGPYLNGSPPGVIARLALRKHGDVDSEADAQYVSSSCVANLAVRRCVGKLFVFATMVKSRVTCVPRLLQACHFAPCSKSVVTATMIKKVSKKGCC